MRCSDCPYLDGATIRAMNPAWEPRLVCCGDEHKQSHGDTNAALSAAELRGRVPAGTPLNNRAQRRRAAAKLRRSA